MRYRQRGVTVIGLLCILALVGVFAYAAVLLVPVYLNYMKIAHGLDAVAAEFKGDTPDQGRLRAALDRHWTVNDVDIVTVKDIEIKKENDKIRMHVAYDHTVPYIGNVSLLVSFDKSVTVE
jgi:Tfp pilus assembly protein PilE